MRLRDGIGLALDFFEDSMRAFEKRGKPVLGVTGNTGVTYARPCRRQYPVDTWGRFVE